MAIAFWLLVIFYVLVLEIVMKGQTPGKLSRNIKLIRLDGASARINNYVRRWLLWPVFLLVVITSFLAATFGLLVLIDDFQDYLWFIIPFSFFTLLMVLRIGLSRRFGDRLTSCICRCREIAATMPTSLRWPILPSVIPGSSWVSCIILMGSKERARRSPRPPARQEPRRRRASPALPADAP